MSDFFKSYLRKCLAILPSVPIAALGVVLFVHVGWGSDPLTTFEIGLSNVLGLQLGTTALLFEGLVFVAFFFLKRNLVNFGTAAWCFLIGPFINVWTDALTPVLPAADEMSIILKLLFILIGSILIIFSLAYYIPIDLGYQTSDILAFTAADMIKKSYGVGLTIAYVILFALGVLMKAPWGVGTLVAVFTFGKVIDFLLPKFAPFSKKIAGMDHETDKQFSAV
ncbi:DUF6198 family protein [Paenibacillus dakarensis]|uniref:DUF6198 family protein n=1 Tax=Paenibacillus dakarensis TaxID=1527293 RepID=UPI0006D5321E|nr:DUF6198 family protein [Paenibacillus dakarensis]